MNNIFFKQSIPIFRHQSNLVSEDVFVEKFKEKNVHSNRITIVLGENLNKKYKNIFLEIFFNEKFFVNKKGGIFLKRKKIYFKIIFNLDKNAFYIIKATKNKGKWKNTIKYNDFSRITNSQIPLYNLSYFFEFSRFFLKDFFEKKFDIENINLNGNELGGDNILTIKDFDYFLREIIYQWYKKSKNYIIPETFENSLKQNGFFEISERLLKNPNLMSCFKEDFNFTDDLIKKIEKRDLITPSVSSFLINYLIYGDDILKEKINIPLDLKIKYNKKFIEFFHLYRDAGKYKLTTFSLIHIFYIYRDFGFIINLKVLGKNPHFDFKTFYYFLANNRYDFHYYQYKEEEKIVHLFEKNKLHKKYQLHLCNHTNTINVNNFIGSFHHVKDLFSIMERKRKVTAFFIHHSSFGMWKCNDEDLWFKSESKIMQNRMENFIKDISYPKLLKKKKIFLRENLVSKIIYSNFAEVIDFLTF